MGKPKVRFKGYTDDWEQRKSGDIAPLRGGFAFKSNEYCSEGVPIIRISNILSDGSVGSDFAYYNEQNYDEVYTLYDGAAVLAMSGATTGKVSVLYAEKGQKYYQNQRVGYFVPTDTCEYSFIRTIMRSQLFADQLFAVLVAGAQPNVSSKEIDGFEFMIPKSKDEQRWIGEYFQSLDHLITLHQRKCENAQKLKKYMLQKMFPKNGTNVPEIRFEGFKDAWEQRKFADFTWDAGKRNREDLDLEPYAITNEHGFIRQCDAHDDFGYMKDTDRKAYNIVQPNSFAYNPARINVGSIGYYKGVENVIVSSLYEVFQTDNYVNDRFLWHWFKSDEFPRWIERLQEGSVRLYFYYDKLCECRLYMPSLEEQEKIASFLDALDHLITLHQHKCEELKNIKKFMLQNMFVQEK